MRERRRFCGIGSCHRAGVVIGCLPTTIRPFVFVPFVPFVSVVAEVRAVRTVAPVSLSSVRNGGEGRGEEELRNGDTVRVDGSPLSPALSPFVPHGAREPDALLVTAVPARTFARTDICLNCRFQAEAARLLARGCWRHWRDWKSCRKFPARSHSAAMERDRETRQFLHLRAVPIPSRTPAGLC